MRLSPPIKGVLIMTIFVCTMLVSFANTQTADGATYCFKYDMSVRKTTVVPAPGQPDNFVRKLGSNRLSSNRLSNGWAWVPGGWVKLGPPNEVSCLTQSLIGKAVQEALRQRKLQLSDQSLANDATQKMDGEEYIFCYDVRKKYPNIAGGWGCGPDREALQASIASLRVKNLAVRNNARPRVKAFMKTDLRAKIRERLSVAVSGAVSGIPKNNWGSKKITRSRNRSQALASGNPKQWYTLLDEALPVLANQAELLRVQYPKFARISAQYKPLLAKCPKRSKAEQKRMAAGELIFADNQAICDKSPIGEYNKTVAVWQSALPVAPEKFGSVGHRFPPFVHGLIGVALRKQASITMAELAKRRNATAYVSLAQKVEKTGLTSNRVCVDRFSKDKNKAVKMPECVQAVNFLLNHERFYVPATQSALAVYNDPQKCLAPSSYEVVRDCSTLLNDAWKAKVQELQKPKPNKLVDFVTSPSSISIGLGILLIAIGIILRYRQRKQGGGS